MVLALALAGGEAAWEAGAGAARLLRSAHIVLGHQSLQLLQRKNPKSFNASPAVQPSVLSASGVPTVLVLR